VVEEAPQMFGGDILSARDVLVLGQPAGKGAELLGVPVDGMRGLALGAAR
jgi:hypothetical protein